MGGFHDRHEDQYVLVIDTDEYAGSFEREMVAFMTGQVGDCGVGEEAAAQFAAEFPDMDLEDMVDKPVDEIGCSRPASIWPSPSFWNDGHGNHHRNEIPIDDPEAIRLCQESVEEYAETIETAYADKEHGMNEAKEYREDNKGGPECHPAYMSVACFLHKLPPESQLLFLVNRAKKYCKERVSHIGPAPIGYLGARLILHKHVDEEIAVF